jgi:hypothetical protein
MTMVKPTTCRKCKGTGGFTYASGMPGTCGSCGGAGKVEGDKATIAAYKARQAEHTRIYPLIVALAKTAPIFSRPSVSFASDGLYLLEANDPARYAKAVASIEAGHPDVVRLLGEYFLANR